MYDSPSTPPTNVCHPSPCGPNSNCKDLNGQAVCACLPQYVGSPPQCRPECISNSECSYDKACVNRKCVEPCAGVCGKNAECNVINHQPICDCIQGHTGSPYYNCYPIPIVIADRKLNVSFDNSNSVHNVQLYIL